MIRKLLPALALIWAFPAFSQFDSPVPKGVVVTTANQKMDFSNLRLSDGQVTFTNSATASEFTYFLSAIRSITDASGTVIYGTVGKSASMQSADNTPPPPVYPESGKNNTIRADMVLMSGDTLHTNIKVPTNLFDSTMINELYVTEGITTFENGKKKKFAPQEVVRLSFTDFKGHDRVFIGNGKSDLIELMFDGHKVKWYRAYYQDASYAVSGVDILVNDKGETVFRGLFSGLRKILKEITASRPDLIPMIDNMKKDDWGIRAVLTEYEKG